MRVLVLFAHPVETSFAAALHQRRVEALGAAGHEVDDCDLYAEGFNPVLSPRGAARLPRRRPQPKPVQPYVDRLRAAEALVVVHPVWNFGYPAILKGFFDRVFLPGVSFQLVNGKAQPKLHNIRKFAVVCTYGGTRCRAWLMGDPPRKVVKRPVRVTIRPGASLRYLALYDMNRSTPESRERFMARVGRRCAASEAPGTVIWPTCLPLRR